MFEVGSGSPSPPSSSPSTPVSRPMLKARRRSGDAAYNIMEECERLFCETLKAVFLVERTTALENSLVMDMRYTNVGSTAVDIPPRQQRTVMQHDLLTPSPSPDTRTYFDNGGLIKEYVEVWDYVGGLRFRGFVAEKDDERSLFIFFDREVAGTDMKKGLIALLELAGTDDFDCSQLIVGVDRNASPEDVDEVTKSLSWVGFELTMLDAWTGQGNCISDRWLFVSMDV